MTQGAEGRGRHILYVDDEESLVYLVTRVLERLGYQVSAFNDPHAALACFRAQPFAYHALITDLAMPGLSGIEFTREVLAIRHDIPIVMTSGYIRAEDREQALAAGIRELVLKPNTVDALGDVLHRLLSGAAKR
ncbi:MAG: response regulator [Steroidobacteraceae bacterium]